MSDPFIHTGDHQRWSEAFYDGEPTVEAGVVVDTLYLQHFVDQVRLSMGLDSGAVNQPTLFR